MGCDIHLRIERRVNGAWADVSWVTPWDVEYRRRPWQSGELLMPPGFDNRNYNLFAVLANVRNGTWGEDVTPIAEPRGWPEDSPTRAAEDGGRWCGDHSWSVVTLAELDAYPWDGPYQHRGWVSPEQAAQFRADGRPPTSYSAGGNRGEYIEWTATVRDATRDWAGAVLPFLKALGAADDVRLCFGFDS